MASLIIARIITAATGFCELGMWQDAWDELDTLKPEERGHSCVAILRLQALIGLKKWRAAASLAESLVDMGSTAPEPFLLGALALRHACTLADCEAFLLRGAAHLLENGLWHYTLACYACQRGDHESAKRRLARALKLRPNLRKVALEDTALQPLWRRRGSSAVPPI